MFVGDMKFFPVTTAFCPITTQNFWFLLPLFLAKGQENFCQKVCINPVPVDGGLHELYQEP